MRIVVISDTHGSHEELNLPPGDVLIHCGDFCNGFNPQSSDLESIDRWFADQDFQSILCVGGNHDFIAQNREHRNETVFEHATYLTDQSAMIDGVHFYGAPWIPGLDAWAYYQPESELKKKWQLLPEGTDILITHTPAYAILDKPRSGISIGCPHLRARIDDLNLTAHCFGHVHASYGEQKVSQTQFINATSVNSDFEVSNAPVIIDI